ncbi:hypothetical protein [Arsenicicoccus dermatophilus]|uniref:hypothetical protein n=1 Tax=Arsenicicoccus dermatophilus TaxID=1076331 RepID=UPI001F4CB3E9|nr:hypothetical protein [Arsenicicoccus dermatophilus]MCH8613826.1 hypothetical protein [Arsenicicoccus dermatophilus]
MSIAGPRAAWARATREERGVGLAALGLLLWFLVRVRSGADLYDGSHVVALAQRIAQGDSLFGDEMNAQAVGSAAGAPFVWVWTHLVGQTGIVLAYRYCYLLVALLVGILCYRALRTRLRPLIAFVAVSASLIVTSYHVVGLSYNTVPTLAMVVLSCCGMAAVLGPPDQARRWVLPVGLLAPLGAVSLQSLLPAVGLSLVVLAVLLWRAGRRAAVWWLLGAALLVTVPVAGYFLGVVGWPRIQETITYTVDYQRPRSTPVERLTFTSLSWLKELTTPVRLPAVLLAASAAIPRLAPRWRQWALVVLPVVLGLTSLLSLWLHNSNVMRYSGSIQLYTAILLVPVCLWWVTSRRDPEVTTLLLLATPTAVVGHPAVAATTFAGPWYGEFPPASVALAIATTVGAARVVQGIRGRVETRPLRAFVLVSTVTLALTQLATNFYSGPPWQALTPAPSGAYSGLYSGGRELWHLQLVQRTTDRWVRPGETLMVYGAVTGAFLTTGARANTNIIWLEDFGGEGRYTVDWMRRTGRTPDVVLVSTDAIQGDGIEAMMHRDPILAALRDTHEVVSGLEYFRPAQFRSEAGLVVLRRTGS